MLAAVSCGGPAQSADAGTKAIPAIYTPAPPVIDGVLEAAFWEAAAVVDDLHMVVPDEFAPPSEASRIYVLYGRDALYFAARFYDREPDKISARVLRHAGRRQYTSPREETSSPASADSV